MNELYIGIGLIVLGFLLFLFIFLSRKPSVSADGGSTAMGGSNSGIVLNTNINQPKEEKHSGGHGLTIVAIIVEIVGIGVTLWHAFHLAAK